METFPDQTDRRILQLLQRNADLTVKAIAEDVGLSFSRVAARIRRLKTSGLILKCVAIVDRVLLEKSLIVFITVQLKQHADGALHRFEKDVDALTEVVECYQLNGSVDYLLKIAVEDTIEFHEFLRNVLDRVANIGAVQTYFVVNECKLETENILK